MSVEFWDQRYAASDFAYGTDPNKFLRDQLAIVKPGTILFPAEGEGRNAVFAAECGWNVTAFDQSVEGKLKADRLAALRGVSFPYTINDHSDAEYAPGSFDAAALIFVHLPPHQRRAFHQKIVQYIKPGGRILLEGFSKDQVRYSSGGPKDESMLFSIGEIRSDFEGMNITKLEQTIVTLREGQYHEGEASVIRFVGERL